MPFDLHMGSDSKAYSGSLVKGLVPPPAGKS